MDQNEHQTFKYLLDPASSDWSIAWELSGPNNLILPSLQTRSSTYSIYEYQPPHHCEPHPKKRKNESMTGAVVYNKASYLVETASILWIES